MVEGWGMSETCAIGTNNPVLSREFSGTIGLPLPSIEIAIKDDDGRSLPEGDAGEICIKGPNVMRGYYQQPDETREGLHIRRVHAHRRRRRSWTSAATRGSSTARRT